MKQVMVMRHADAEWSGAAKGDHARHLSDKGRADAKAMGDFMAASGMAPDVVYCSSAQRTRETLDLILPALKEKSQQESPEKPQVLLEEGLYNADEPALLNFVLSGPPEADSLLLLAHNPGVHGFALGLLSEVEAGVGAHALSEGYPPGTLSVFSFDVESWADVAPHTGALTHCHAPA